MKIFFHYICTSTVQCLKKEYRIYLRSIIFEFLNIHTIFSNRHNLTLCTSAHLTRYTEHLFQAFSNTTPSLMCFWRWAAALDTIADTACLYAATSPENQMYTSVTPWYISEVKTLLKYSTEQQCFFQIHTKVKLIMYPILPHFPDKYSNQILTKEYTWKVCICTICTVPVFERSEAEWDDTGCTVRYDTECCKRWPFWASL